VPTSLARKIAAAKKEAAKARAGKNSFPPTPFLFARPSGKVLVLPRTKHGNQNPQSGFSSKKVRTSIKKHRQVARC